MKIELKKTKASYKTQIISSISYYKDYIFMIKKKYLLPIYIIAYIPFIILTILEIIVISIILIYLLICIGLYKIHVLEDDYTKVDNSHI